MAELQSTMQAPAAEVEGALAISPWITGGVVANEFAAALIGKRPDAADVAETLLGEIEKVRAGDMGQAEAMLTAQAVVLQSMFMAFSAKASAHLGPPTDALERYMRLAFKAQNQSRMTLETLATIKNPPVVFARQANIAHGPQQVNNGKVAPAGKMSAVQNELQEKICGECVNLATRAPAAAAGGHPALTALGTINRPKNARRQA